MVMRILVGAIEGSILGWTVAISVVAWFWRAGYLAWMRGARVTECRSAGGSWRARLWISGYLAGRGAADLRRIDEEREHLLLHLAAVAGEEQTRIARAGLPTPAPAVALALAEDRYLERTGWARAEDGEGWCPPWAPEETWTRARALERQRRGDSVRPALKALMGIVA